jgi:Domain of unknown function (DUF4908)
MAQISRFARLASRFCRGALIALATASVGFAAHAADSDRIGHFTTADGEVGFVLDLSGETPRERFDASPEILLLTPVAATRGDTIYRVSNGNIVLRGTPFGALTLFSQGHETGVPLVRTGAAASLLPRNRTMEEVNALATALEQHLVRAHQVAVAVSIPKPDKLTLQSALNTLGDAIENTDLALSRVAVTPQAASDLRKMISAVKFRVGIVRGVDVDGHALIIDIVPAMQLAGRPSSYDIADRVRGAIAQARALAEGLAAQSEADKDQHSFDFRW